MAVYYYFYSGGCKAITKEKDIFRFVKQKLDFIEEFCVYLVCQDEGEDKTFFSGFNSVDWL